MFLVLTSIFLTFPLFLVAVDWGRLLYIHLVSVYFLTQSLSDTEGALYFKQNIPIRNIALLVLLIVYFLSWRIPHVPENPLARNFSGLNTLSVPIIYNKVFVNN